MHRAEHLEPVLDGSIALTDCLEAVRLRGPWRSLGRSILMMVSIVSGEKGASDTENELSLWGCVVGNDGTNGEL